jgi:hypothetical protein
MTNADNLIEKIAKERGIKIEFLEVSNFHKFDDIKDNCFIAGCDEIFIGIYTDDEFKLISFFHELAHTEISNEFIKGVNYNSLLIEIECWNIAIRIAKSYEILFTDEAIRFGYMKALSYVGHDERERSNYKEDIKPTLWKYSEVKNELLSCA